MLCCGFFVAVSSNRFLVNADGTISTRDLHWRINTKFMYLKTTFVALVGSVCLTCSGIAQDTDSAHELEMTAPSYQPDANGNGLIATYDLMELLSIFGQEFEAPEVLPATTVEALITQVELLSRVVELQSNQLQMLQTVLAGVEASRQSPPFVWDPEREVWVCQESVLVQGGVSSGAIFTNRLEAGSAQMGGLRVN